MLMVSAHVCTLGQQNRVHGSKWKFPFCFWRVASSAPHPPWNITQFTVFCVHRITCFPVFWASASSPPWSDCTQAPTQAILWTKKMFTWSVLKNLTSLEFSQQNLKNVTHGSKAKTKLNLKKAWFPPGSLHLGRGTGRWTNKATLSWFQAQRSKTNKKEQRPEVSPGSMGLDMVLVQKWRAYLRTQMNCWAWNNDSTTTDKSESNWRLQEANKKMISRCSSKPASEFRGKKEDK